MSVSFMHGEYFCEICDRSWVTPEELETHLSEHISCHVDGCTFNAAPKVVALHVKLQHESGVFDRIVQGYNTEEIEKWKAERRRNYPTIENIERKIATEKEMDDRGERIIENNESFKHIRGFQLKNDRRHGANSNNKFKKKKRRNPGGAVKQQFLSTASLNEESLKDSQDEVMEGAEQHFSDEEWAKDEPVNREKSAPMSKILMDLSASYASDSEDEDSEVQKDNEKPSASNNIESDNDAPTEEKISRESDNLPNIHLERNKKIDLSCKQTSSKVIKKPHIDNKVNNMNWKPDIRKRPLTLLEKLLAKEIRQERNHIMQCIRYIIEENFFEEKKIAS